MANVLSKSGIPVASDFAGSTGTPVVVDTTTGYAYIYVNGVVIRQNVYVSTTAPSSPNVNDLWFDIS